LRKSEQVLFDNIKRRTKGCIIARALYKATSFCEENELRRLSWMGCRRVTAPSFEMR
jgi:hypothetical protein